MHTSKKIFAQEFVESNDDIQQWLDFLSGKDEET